MDRDNISSKLRERVLERDKYTCRYCGSKKPPFHLDHVYPFSKGGETSFHNLVTSCEKCNHEKYNHVGIHPKPIGYFRKRNSRLLFFTFVLIVWDIIGVYMISMLGSIKISSIVLLILTSMPYLIVIYAQSDFYSTGE